MPGKPLSGRELILAVCDVYGIPSEYAHKVTFSALAGDIVIITVHLFTDQEKLEAIGLYSEGEDAKGGQGKTGPSSTPG